MASEEKDPIALWNLHKQHIVPMLYSYLDIANFIESRL